jgi:hypothetical protein
MKNFRALARRYTTLSLSRACSNQPNKVITTKQSIHCYSQSLELKIHRKSKFMPLITHCCFSGTKLKLMQNVFTLTNDIWTVPSFYVMGQYIKAYNDFIHNIRPEHSFTIHQASSLPELKQTMLDDLQLSNCTKMYNHFFQNDRSIAFMVKVNHCKTHSIYLPRKYCCRHLSV